MSTSGKTHYAYDASHIGQDCGGHLSLPSAGELSELGLTTLKSGLPRPVHKAAVCSKTPAAAGLPELGLAGIKSGLPRPAGEEVYEHPTPGEQRESEKREKEERIDKSNEIPHFHITSSSTTMTSLPDHVMTALNSRKFSTGSQSTPVTGQDHSEFAPVTAQGHR